MTERIGGLNHLSGTRLALEAAGTGLICEADPDWGWRTDAEHAPLKIKFTNHPSTGETNLVQRTQLPESGIPTQDKS